MSTTQPEALRLADWLEDQVVIYQQFSEGEPGGYAQEVDQVMDEAAAELRRQHADLAHAARYAEQLGRELSKAGAEIADLSARVQELGQMARDVNSRRVVELEAQLASIGAGGVSALMGAVNAGSAPAAPPSDADAILSKVCDLFHIGKLARTESTILTNVSNVIRFTGLLRAIERDLFPQPELPDDDDPYAEVDDDLPAPNSWSANDEEDYVSQFRAALAARGFTHPSPPEGAGWRPIETAPKDSTARLVWCPERQNIYAVTWLAKKGWLIFGGRLLADDEAPSHWRELPAPPLASEAKGASHD